MLNTKKTINKGILEVALEGRLDSTTVPFFDEEMNAMYNGIEGIIFDMTKLEYISSAGLRVIIKAKKYIGNVVVKNLNPDVRNVFEMTGFDKMLEIQ